MLLVSGEASGQAPSSGLDLWWKLSNATARGGGHVPPSEEQVVTAPKQVLRTLIRPVGKQGIWITAALGPLLILPQTLKLMEPLDP